MNHRLRRSPPSPFALGASAAALEPASALILGRGEGRLSAYDFAAPCSGHYLRDFKREIRNNNQLPGGTACDKFDESSVAQVELSHKVTKT